jgi:hypothetical protein
VSICDACRRNVDAPPPRLKLIRRTGILYFDLVRLAGAGKMDKPEGLCYLISQIKLVEKRARANRAKRRELSHLAPESHAN